MSVSQRWTTSQNGTAPKLFDVKCVAYVRWTTSQNGTAPKPLRDVTPVGPVGLPVRTALLQNTARSYSDVSAVGLPVRTALLQNR